MSTRVWFWDKIARRYARTPIADQASYEQKLAFTRAYFSPLSRVLEIGCGTGSTAILHAPYVEHYHAIDCSGQMLEIARQKVAESALENLSFKQATIERLDSPEGEWDAVLAMSVLHLLDHRGKALRKIHSLLKPGGVFISSTVCLGDSPLKFRMLAPLFRMLPFMPRFTAFKRDELIADIESAGFQVEKTWCPGPSKAVFIVARQQSPRAASA
ncbi:class I SAM-dependent methyltransferase [Nitrogeniibacter aestuarii]|uniref:class I SAM-dependent methyltransferase n=1 Tax=Nitrogeniibacter aestuarii TaxID=2815343 RepID=UPI001D1063F8|nr:class I SAM-dependent methyltransferase [Nitrogeniibacter aestuarii]